MINQPKLGFAIRFMIGMVAIVAALALPLAYFTFGYWFQLGEIKTDADAFSEIIVREAKAHQRLGNAGMNKIQEMIDERRHAGELVKYRVLINAGNQVFGDIDGVEGQSDITHSFELMDDGKSIGRLEISSSLRPLIYDTQIAGLLGLLLGTLIYYFLRETPLRALTTSFREMNERNDMQENLQHSVSMLRATLESTADGIIVSNNYGGITRFNQRYIDMWRIPEEAVASGDHNLMLAAVVEQLIEPHGFLKKLAELRGVDVQSDIENHGLLELKDNRTFEWNSIPQRIDEKIVGRVWSFHDITERKKAENIIFGEKRILEAIINGMPLVEMLEMLARNIELQSGKMFCSFLLIDEQGANLQHKAAGNLPANFIQEVSSLSISAQAHQQDQENLNELLDIAKEAAWLEWCNLAQKHGLQAKRVAPVISSGGSILGAIVTYYSESREPDEHDLELVKLAVNISKIAIERRESEEQLDYLAHYDMLTGLPGRILFRDRLIRAMAKAERNGQLAALMFIDLDRFKSINDTLGHSAGDELLKTIAQRLTACVREEDTVARLGGDEFTIIMDQIHNVDSAGLVARKILDSIAVPIQINEHEIFITASIGITVFPLDSNNQDELINNADTAMYRAKEEGKNGYEFYSKEMNSQTSERLAMENELHHAIERNEFVLYYQPKVEIKSGRILSMEALLRWEHPVRGIVSPEKFIPLLEESGMITVVGEWVIRTACEQNKIWLDEGYGPLRVAVNLSARQFQHNDVVKNIGEILRETGLNAGSLEVEVTESMLMKNPEQVILALNAIKAMGVVRINIDDFGTGYSSLSYLKKFPISTVKIDRSFVNGIPHDEEDVAITRAVIGMAHSLNLNVIAEGVENLEQHAFLRREGCDEIQGYLFSKPLPAKQFTQLLKDNQIDEIRRHWQYQ